MPTQNEITENTRVHDVKSDEKRQTAQGRERHRKHKRKKVFERLIAYGVCDDCQIMEGITKVLGMLRCLLRSDQKTQISQHYLGWLRVALTRGSWSVPYIAEAYWSCGRITARTLVILGGNVFT